MTRNCVTVYCVGSYHRIILSLCVEVLIHFVQQVLAMGFMRLIAALSFNTCNRMIVYRDL